MAGHGFGGRRSWKDLGPGSIRPGPQFSHLSKGRSWIPAPCEELVGSCPGSSTILIVSSPGSGASPSPPTHQRGYRTSSAWTSHSASQASWPSLTTTCLPSRESSHPSGPGQRHAMLPAPSLHASACGAGEGTEPPYSTSQHWLHACCKSPMPLGLGFPFWKVGVMG